MTTTTTTSAESIANPLKRKDRSGDYDCLKCEQVTHHYADGKCSDCKRRYNAERDASGERWCDKCNAITKHAKTGFCNSCSVKYKHGLPLFRMCGGCGVETNHYKSGECVPCQKAMKAAVDRRGIRHCETCGVETERTKCGQCKPCHAASMLCPCGKQRYYCKDHCTDEEKRLSKQWCIVCLDKRLSPQRIRDSMRTCAECDPTVPQRIELVLRPKFEALLGPAHLFDKQIGGKGCGADKTWTRPDMLWLTCDDDFANMRIVVIECDENSHCDEEASCHAARMSKQHEALQVGRRDTRRTCRNFANATAVCGTPGVWSRGRSHRLSAVQPGRL
jgi:hypothetical protein